MWTLHRKVCADLMMTLHKCMTWTTDNSVELLHLLPVLLAWLLGYSIGSWWCGAYTPRSDASLDQLAGSFLCTLHLDSSQVCTCMQVDEPNTNKVSNNNNYKFLLTSKYGKCPVQGHPKVKLWHLTFSCDARPYLDTNQAIKRERNDCDELWNNKSPFHLHLEC